MTEEEVAAQYEHICQLAFRFERNELLAKGVGLL